MLLIFCFLAILPGQARAEITPLSVVSPQTFADGRHWTWDYVDAKANTLYSSETYTVVSHDPDGSIWIEMSSQLLGEKAFTPHQRMHVKVEDCLRAYQDPLNYHPWSFDMFYRDGERWVAYDLNGNNLAFEEKFNCIPTWDNSSRLYAFQSKTTDAGPLFRLLKWGKLATSWFHREGTDEGVAAEKEFDGRYFFRQRPSAP